MLARAFVATLCLSVVQGIGQGNETRASDVIEVVPATEAPVAPDTWVSVPALTPLYVRIDEEISSKKHRNGDRFRILIDEDVLVGGAMVIPAGSEGEGEVIHAARSGAGGKPGELLLAARFVRVGELEVRLRSFSLGASGRDRLNESLAAAVVTGPLGLFVVGGAMIIPRGTVASAKVAMEIQMPALSPVDKRRGGDDEAQDF
ncbi:MAG TPA: hypothetical protein VFS58_04425 [Steroidobacteraceae bacterium]|nr:hypothetical protein [Steroidobacteraceae bacterium]